MCNEVVWGGFEVFWGVSTVPRFYLKRLIESNMKKIK